LPLHNLDVYRSVALTCPSRKCVSFPLVKTIFTNQL
jgi:hypothetical protein